MNEIDEGQVLIVLVKTWPFLFILFIFATLKIMKKDIVLLLKYFDFFDYPLTLDEIWQWLYRVKDIKKEQLTIFLKDLEQEKIIEFKDNLYFLLGREILIKVRQERKLISLKKIKKAQRIARLLGLIPGVKMIAVCSNLGYLNALLDSDIDLFIVTEVGKIWSVRFWSVILMKFFRQRPTKMVSKNKICLSYFVDEDHLDLSKTAVDDNDMHLVYLMSQHIPIYSEGDMWHKFIQANSWINKYLNNFKYNDQLKSYMIKPLLVNIKKMTNGGSFKFEEDFYKAIQHRFMAKELREGMQANNKKVIIKEGILKLHSNDRREEINKKFLHDEAVE